MQITETRIAFSCPDQRMRLYLAAVTGVTAIQLRLHVHVYQHTLFLHDDLPS